MRQECVEDQRHVYSLTAEGAEQTVAAMNSYNQLIKKVNLSQIQHLARITNDSQ